MPDGREEIEVKIALERLAVKVEFLSADIQRLLTAGENSVKKDDFKSLEEKVTALQAEKGHWFDRVAAIIIAAIVSAVIGVYSNK